MTKSLFVLIVVGLMIAAGLFYDRLASTTPVDSDVPATAEQQAEPEAAAVSGVDFSALDRSTRPQDDFYQFANGGWLDTTEIPEIYSGYTVYHEVFEEAEKALRLIIEEAAANPEPPGSESQQVGDIYNSWMDEEAINSAGIDPVKTELELIDSISDMQSLTKVMAELDRRGVMIPFGMAIYGDKKDASQYAVYLYQRGLTLPNRDYYIDTDNEKLTTAREALPGYIAEMLQIAGSEAGQAEQQAASVFSIEDSLARAHWTSVENRDPVKTYNPYPVDELSELGSNLDWPVFRETAGIAPAEKLVVQQPSYLEAMDALLASVPLDDWKSYLRFRVLDSFGTDLDERTAQTRFEFRNRLLNGQQEQRPRWKRGISKVNSMVGEAVGKLYVASYFPPEAKAKMEQLVDNVIATLDDDLARLEWMGPETRDKAREKLSRFTAKIGYPDEWKDYSNLEIVAGDHMGNLKRSNEWKHQRAVDKIGKPVDRNEWFMTPQTVNAYYSPTQNEIVFPAARLQPPFFQLDADDAINYGAVGGVIGHEISHGFDDSGSQYDGDGNLNNWWTEEDRAAFDERTQMLVEQFNTFVPVEGMTVNGELTLGENIGDLSGISMAYRAYIRSLNGEPAPVIDGFTGPQRFFIGYAMSRKGKYHDEAIISRLTSAPHSPLEFRVIGPYRNIDAFHEAFETQPGDGMWLAPEERVRLW